MFRFASPYAFFLLLPLAVAALFIWRRGVRSGFLFAPVSWLPTRVTTMRAWLGVLLPLLTLLGALLSIIAAARPQTVMSEVRDRMNVIAIEMVVDVSGSMRGLDFSTKKSNGKWDYRTRLDVVKDTFAEFIEQRPDDLIGLVTFGGFATTRAPLTADHRALQHVLKAVEIPSTDVNKEGGITSAEELQTAIGDGLATAAARLEKAEPKSRIIVLLSDGESNAGIIQPGEAMQAAKELGIRIYTIGVGSTSNRVPIFTRDRFNRKVIDYVNMRLNETELKRISEHTEGKYYNVKNPSGLEEALESINELETTEIERSIYTQYEEWFTLFLLPGAALILLGLTLNMFATRRLI